MQKPVVPCPKCEGVNMTEQTDYKLKWNCNICNQKVQPGNYKLRCEQHDQSICEQCASLLIGFDFQYQQLISECESCHYPLQNLTNKNEKWNCKNCKKTYNHAESLRLNCKTHQYNICGNCCLGQQFYLRQKQPNGSSMKGNQNGFNAPPNQQGGFNAPPGFNPPPNQQRGFNAPPGFNPPPKQQQGFNQPPVQEVKLTQHQITIAKELQYQQNQLNGKYDYVNKQLKENEDRLQKILKDKSDVEQRNQKELLEKQNEINEKIQKHEQKLKESMEKFVADLEIKRLAWEKHQNGEREVEQKVCKDMIDKVLITHKVRLDDFAVKIQVNKQKQDEIMLFKKKHDEEQNMISQRYNKEGIPCPHTV